MDLSSYDLRTAGAMLKTGHTPAQSELLRGLTAYYIETRYPEDARKIARETGREKSRSYLRRTREIMAWLRKELL